MSDLCIQNEQNPKIVKKTISKQSPKKNRFKTQKWEQSEQKLLEKNNRLEERQDIINNISFETCREEYFDQMVDLVTNIFVSSEPICNSCSVSYNDLRLFVYKIAKIGINLSSVAVFKSTGENGNTIYQVISAMISCDQKDLVRIEKELNENNVPQIENILNIFNLAISKLHEIVGIDLHNPQEKEIVHQVLIGTHKDFQKMGIGFALALHNAYICQKQGFQYAVMELTSKCSLNLCKLSNIGSIIYSVKYRELKELEQFKLGLSQMQEPLLEEEFSVYFVKAADFQYSKYEHLVKDLQFIF